MDAGVFILEFLVVSDQSRNIDNLVKTDMVISVDMFFVSKEEFFNNVVELINNKK